MLKGVGSLSDQIAVYELLDRPYNGFPFLRNLGRWGRDCDFERWMRTARRHVCGLAQYSDVCSATVPAWSAYAFVFEWWYGYECRRELNVPSPPVLAYLASHIVDEADLCNVSWRIAVFEFSVFVLAFFLACVRVRLGFRWGIDART